MKMSFAGVIRVLAMKLRNEKIKFSLGFSAFGDEVKRKEFQTITLRRLRKVWVNGDIIRNLGNSDEEGGWAGGESIVKTLMDENLNMRALSLTDSGLARLQQSPRRPLVCGKPLSIAIVS